MTSRSALRFVVPALLVSAFAQAEAQVVTVTTPVGTTTNTTTTSVGISDPFAVDAWMRNNVRGGSTVGITNNYARAGNGSAYMQGTIAGTSKGDMEYVFGGQYATPFTLNSLTALSYEYYRSSSSTADAHFAPSLRLMIDEDGIIGGTDQGLLIFEPIYNGTSVVPVDQWVTTAISSASSFWWRQFNPGNTVLPFGETLATYMSSTGVTSANRTINGNSLVYGLSSGIGSGWNGSYEGAVDNIQIAYGNTDVTFNFETEAVVATPEPASIVLLATGFVGIAGFARRRRKA